MEWIKVSDRLPDKSGDCFISNGSLVRIAYFSKSEIYSQFATISAHEITHWMPINFPKPPKN